MSGKPLTQDLLIESIRIAVLGSGGREHALAAKIAESPLAEKVFVLPGNDGMVRGGSTKISCKPEGLPALFERPSELADKLKKLNVDFVVVGPDALLAEGIVDALTKEGLLVFGPTRAAAKLEWSKAFAKEVMQKAGVPTAH